MPRAVYGLIGLVPGRRGVVRAVDALDVQPLTRAAVATATVLDDGSDEPRAALQVAH